MERDSTDGPGTDLSALGNVVVRGEDTVLNLVALSRALALKPCQMEEELLKCSLVPRGWQAPYFVLPLYFESAD